jgi:lysozyme family protein
MRCNFGAALSFGQRPDFDGQGLHNTAGDSGGWTAYGVTLSTFAEFCRRQGRPTPTPHDLGAITHADVAAIYLQFWDAVRGDQLPCGVDLVAFDFANGSGPHNSIVLLQLAAGVPGDGVFGPATLAAVLRADPDVLIDRLTHRDEDFYAHCASAGLFLRGWDRRAEARCVAAHAEAAAWRAKAAAARAVLAAA